MKTNTLRIINIGLICLLAIASYLSFHGLDIRIDLKNELPIAISELFSLKPTLRFMWRNAPALTEVELFDSTGADTGSTVFVPLQHLDTLFTLALVFKI